MNSQYREQKIHELRPPTADAGWSPSLVRTIDLDLRNVLSIYSGGGIF